MIGATEIKSKSVLSKSNRQGSQGYVNIKKKSKEELEELIERQNKLLLNRCFTQKLPDKGEKLISFKIQLENELKKREESDATCNLLNKLTLNDPNDIEWNQGKSKTNLSYEKHFDSDDEDYDDESIQVDPLKLLATHSGTVNRGKIILRGSTCLNGGQKLCYVDKFCEKYGEVSKRKERFKPNQLKNNVKDQFVTSAEKVKQKFGDKWEVTQATPPIPVFKNTVMISLSESLNLQKQQAQKLKEIEKTYATERLLQNIGVKMGDKLPVINVNKYRTQTDNFDETIESDEEGCKDSETENEENNLIFPGVHASTKPTLPLSNRKPKTISSYQGRTLKVSKYVSEREGCEFPFKVQEERKNNESPILKRPNTVFGNSRRKSEWEGNDGSKEKNGKSCDRVTVGSTNTASKNSKQINPRSASSSKAPNKTNKVPFSQLPGSVSLLALAVKAQEQTTAAMRLLRSSLRKKAEEIQAKPKNDQKVVDPTAKPNLYLSRSACFFENSYASCLDEVFQAWVNLLYLITNLKITLNEVVEVPGTETFRPDLESEKTLITQAIECVKFFSQLKMRSLMESFEENNIIEDPEMHNFQILDFEKRISSSFFSEMDTLSEKAKEMMDHIKIETPSDIN